MKVLSFKSPEYVHMQVLTFKWKTIVENRLFVFGFFNFMNLDKHI